MPSSLRPGQQLARARGTGSGWPARRARRRGRTSSCSAPGENQVITPSRSVAMNAVPLAESSSWPSWSSFSRRRRSESRRWLVATENATAVIALISDEDLGAGRDGEQRRLPGDVGERPVPERRERRRPRGHARPARGRTTGAGTGRRPTSAPAGAGRPPAARDRPAMQAVSAGDHEEAVQGDLERGDTDAVRAAAASPAGAATAWAPPWVTAIHSSVRHGRRPRPVGDPQRVAEVITPAARLPDADARPASAGSHPRSAAAGTPSSKRVSHHTTTSTSTALATAKPRRDRPVAAGQDADCEQARRGQEREPAGVAPGEQQEQDGDQRRGRPPPRDQLRVGCGVQGAVGRPAASMRSGQLQAGLCPREPSHRWNPRRP